MLYRLILISLLVFSFCTNLNAQAGCTDPQANNYNAAASANNGSCTYAAQSTTPVQRANLSDVLREISGMVYFNGKLLVLNDGGNGNKLFIIDSTTGAVLQTITVEGATNVDWEDMTQDSSYVYVGDFGNNANGNRTDLGIYRIERAAFFQPGDFTIPSAAITKINFTYPDQTDFTPVGNQTRFDCEAMVAHRGKLHLFSKNRLGNFSVHYSLPTEPGTYAATRLDSMNTGGMLITGASLGADDEIILTSYNTGALTASFFLVYGFDSSQYYFNTGNKRQIQLPSVLTTGQLESVCFVNGLHGFIANEYAVNGITITNKLKVFNIEQYIIDHYKHNTPVMISEPGMLRFNTTTNKYEVFTGTLWEDLH